MSAERDLAAPAGATAPTGPREEPPLRCAVVTSTTPDLVPALDGLCERLEQALDGARPDLLVAFYTPHHSAEVPALGERLLRRLDPVVLMGCPAAGVIGEQVEIESQAGLTLWAASWPGAELVPFHLEAHKQGEDGPPQLSGWPEGLSADPDDGPGFVLLADPYSTPADELLTQFHTRYPGAPVVGGVASGSSGPGEALLLSRDGVQDGGVLGLAVGGAVRLDPVVSQGCRPVGRHFVVTRAERNVIRGLGGQPALAQLRQVIELAEGRDRELMQHALHVGRVVDERQSRFETGDFLVRNVLGIDPASEAIAIGDFVRAGQTIQFMVRDPRSAAGELRTLLDRRASGGGALGSLLFSCNGRGQRFFGEPHSDVGNVLGGTGDAPVGGFFCAGEIGPVGGQPFLHGYTASVAVFRKRG